MRKIWRRGQSIKHAARNIQLTTRRSMIIPMTFPLSCYHIGETMGHLRRNSTPSYFFNEGGFPR